MTKSKSSTGTGQLTDRQILDLGQMASEALKNPIFGIIFDKQCRTLYQQWQSAAADHTKEMGFLKAKHMVLQEIMQDMVSMVSHAERVYAEMQEKNSPATAERERLDTQGFGLRFNDQGEQVS